jgi:BMFP domain-containing protein YqiC
MQSQSRLLEDLARVASGALGVAAGMREEAEARLRDQFERVLARFDLVTREEFDAVKAMAVKAREEQEDLAARLAALEQAVQGKAAGRKTSAGKTSRSKTARKKVAKAGGAD